MAVLCTKETAAAGAGQLQRSAFGPIQLKHPMEGGGMRGTTAERLRLQNAEACIDAEAFRQSTSSSGISGPPETKVA